MQKIVLFALVCLLSSSLFSQGYFSGDLELRNDYYVRDTSIGAAGTNHFDDLKSSMDSWLTINYSNPDIDFDAGLRFDMYLNSRLHNPNQEAYSALGIGRWYVRKSFNKLTLTGGSFYDQFGSGMIFRSYEDRFLGIDNAIYGLHAKYELNDNLNLKAFGGVRKDRLEYTKTFVKGVNLEGYYPLGEDGVVTLSPGIATVNRTIDEESMTVIANAINGYANIDDRFIPKYNTYLFSAYNTLTFKRFSWYIEGAYKTKEAIKVAEGVPYENKAGSALFTSLTYTQKGFGITGQFKRIDHFQFRSSPEHTGTILNGGMNFIPPINRQNSLRLPARYAPNANDVQETSLSIDLTYTPERGKTLNFSFSELHTNQIDFDRYAQDVLFREIYADFTWKISKKSKLMLGGQFVQYNQEFYEGKTSADYLVQAYSPFTEFTYKFDRKKSIRIELQYQHAVDDFGQWMYGLVEFNVAPKLSFSVSDMWNFKPGPNESSSNQHYYSVFASYTEKQHRFYVSYVRQVQGIVCTGGVCRLEPAFNGVRAGINTSF